MIADLKPYPEYKDSGVAWLGVVPRHWRVLPNRAVFTEVKERDHPDEQMLSVTITKGVIPQKALLSDSSKKDSSNQDKSAYKLVRPGDIAYNKMRAWQGALGVSDDRGIISPAYVVQRPREDVESRYVHYLLRTPAFAQEAERWSYGITSDMWSLRPEHFKLIYGCLPPPAEQTAIVRFLDHADRRIRRYIHAKHKLIKLLEEQKQAIIHRAVTRGLDPEVRLKPSGVEWLGEVPEHWVVASLRFRYHQCLGKMVDAKRETGKYPIPYLRNVDVQWDRINTADLPQIDIAPGERERYTVRSGDLLVCEGRHLGRAAFWRGDFSPCAFQKALHRLRARNPRMDAPRWLFYCLYVVHFQDAFGASSHDNSIPHLTGEMLRAHKFPFPSFDEQTLIAAYIDEKVAAIDQARALITCEIERVLEYRTRLIADLITGKLDVREAAGLPDESDELEPLNEAEPDMEYVAAAHLDTVPEETEA